MRSTCSSARGLALAPVGPDGQRRIGRIGDGLETLDAAQLDRVAPVLVHVRLERTNVRHARMHVTIDGPCPLRAQPSLLMTVLPLQHCILSRRHAENHPRLVYGFPTAPNRPYCVATKPDARMATIRSQPDPFCWTLALLAATLTAPGSRAHAAAPVQMQPDGTLQIAGRTVQCGRARNVLDPHMPNLGMASRRRNEVILNPARLSRYPEHRGPVRLPSRMRPSPYRRRRAGGRLLGSRPRRARRLARPASSGIDLQLLRQPARDGNPSGRWRSLRQPAPVLHRRLGHI